MSKLTSKPSVLKARTALEPIVVPSVVATAPTWQDAGSYYSLPVKGNRLDCIMKTALAKAGIEDIDASSINAFWSASVKRPAYQKGSDGKKDLNSPVLSFGRHMVFCEPQKVVTSTGWTATAADTFNSSTEQLDAYSETAEADAPDLVF